MTAAYDMFADEYEGDIVDASRVHWPSAVWRGRHVEFARDVLGLRTLAKHQAEILDAYYGPGRIEIAVCTGQKLGKTETLLIIMLCDWAIEQRLNFYLFGPTIDWIDEAIWPRFVPMALGAFYPCGECLPAHRAWCALVNADPMDETPRPSRCAKCSPLVKPEWLDKNSCEGGLRDRETGRAIRGYTSIKEGAKGGFSGNVRFAADESSDVSDITRETIRGNMSGGGKFIAFGNLLHVDGWFALAFGRKRAEYSHVFQMSSRMSPNCAGRIVWSDGVVTANDNAGRPVRGMATRKDIEANLRAWANNRNYICARIDAKPPEIVEGQLADMGRVVLAERRWSQVECLKATGILQIGVDVARARDKLAIAVRRGRIITDLHAEALHQDDHAQGVALVLDFVRKHRKPHERKPRLVFDESGPEGAAFRRELRAQNAENECEIYGVQMSFCPRGPEAWKLYDKWRDQLACEFAQWLKMGAVPVDADLEGEIEATTSERVEVSYGGTGRKWTVHRVITNDDLRKKLGRSPDKRNACELAVWDVDGSEKEASTPNAAPTRPDAPRAIQIDAVTHHARRTSAAANDDFGPMFDPYAAADQMLETLWGHDEHV